MRLKCKSLNEEQNELQYMQAVRKGPHILLSVNMCHVRGGDREHWVWTKRGGVGRVL